MEDGQALADGVVHARTHAQDHLVARYLARVLDGCNKLGVRNVEKMVHALDVGVDGLLLGHVEGHHPAVLLVAEPHPVSHEKPRLIGGNLKTDAFWQNRVRTPFRLVRGLLKVIPHPARLGKVARKTERRQTRAHRLVHEEDAPLVIGADDALGQCPNGIDDRQTRNGAPPGAHIEG